MYIDADVIYAHIKSTDWLKLYADKIISLKNLQTSIISITELEIVSKRDFQDDFYNNVLEKIKKIKNLTIINLDIPILEKAIELRKKYNLGIFDSIHIATAIILKEKVIISSDSAFDNLAEIKREDPRMYK